MNELNLKVNVSYADGSLGDSTNHETSLILFILWGIVLPLIASIGLVGNILTIIVLWRREMHSTTILYLRALVITDTGILIGSVITLTPISCAKYLHGEALDYFKDSIYPLIHTPGYYIIMALQQCNVWITVSVSIERYIAICQPFRAARLLTRTKTLLVIFIIALVSLIYNIPHLFASASEDCTAPPPQSTSPPDMTQPGDENVLVSPMLLSTTTSSAFLTSSLSSSSLPSSSSSSLSSSSTSPSPSEGSSNIDGCLRVSTTDFGSTTLYKTYRTVMYCIVIYVIPFFALLILNIFLIKELMVMQNRRTGTNIHEENEANLSLVLVLIVIVFIFCQTPGLISQFDVIPLHVFYHWLAVSNLLFACNSAVNFLIYTAFGRKFRRVLLRVFRHIFSTTRRQSQSSYRATATQITCNGYEASAPDVTQVGSLQGSLGRNIGGGFHSKNPETVPLTQSSHFGRCNGFPNGTTPVVHEQGESKLSSLLDAGEEAEDVFRPPGEEATKKTSNHNNHNNHSPNSHNHQNDNNHRISVPNHEAENFQRKEDAVGGQEGTTADQNGDAAGSRDAETSLFLPMS